MQAAVLALVLAFAGCQADGPDRQPLRVFAASSLTDAFREMAGAFEGAHPDTDVVLVFAGSQVLRLQIEQGAPADVFASANAQHMQALVQDGLVSGQRVLARNELVVIVPPANPAGIESFADLVRAERIVIGTPNVPVGVYAREALRRAGSGGGGAFEEEVLDRVVSEESNVRLVRAKVELGEADAAIVYRTDAVHGRVQTVQLPPGVNVRARYLIGTVQSAGNAAAAERWAEFAASPQGRRILSRHGFLAGTTATAQ
jgi:molybdate transport system substrate-binding protein